MMENVIRELERGVYLTIGAVKLRCAENGDVNCLVAVNEIARRCLRLPRIQHERKPQA